MLTSTGELITAGCILKRTINEQIEEFLGIISVSGNVAWGTVPVLSPDKAETIARGRLYTENEIQTKGFSLVGEEVTNE